MLSYGSSSGEQDPTDSIGLLPLEPVGQFDRDTPFPPLFPFAPDSMVRQMYAEPVVGMLAVHRALVMDVSHPEVGIAVKEHSSVQRQPLGRAFDTADTAMRLVFGNADQARDAAEHIYEIHDRINGPMVESVGPWEEGFTYSAHHAEALLWVWATLADSYRTYFERYVRPLTSDEENHTYKELADFAEFFGIPKDFIPPDPHAFYEYMDGMFDSGVLGSTDDCREMADMVLNFHHKTVPGPVVVPLRLMTTRTLDPRLNQSLGNRLNRREQMLAEVTDSAFKRAHNLTPEPIRTCVVPIYMGVRSIASGINDRLPHGRFKGHHRHN